MRPLEVGLALLLLAGLTIGATLWGFSSSYESDFGSLSNWPVSEWPSAYAQLCEQQLSAVIAQCKATGLENWRVNRRVVGTDFLVQRLTIIEDLLVENERCPYNENRFEKEVRLNSQLNIACPAMRAEKLVRGTDYACSFSCEAWSCSARLRANEIAGCTVDPSQGNSFQQQSAECQERMRTNCAAVGDTCQLSTNCRVMPEFQNRVFCDCSCTPGVHTANLPETIPVASITLEQFDAEQWKSQNAPSCGVDYSFTSSQAQGLSETALRTTIEEDLLPVLSPQALSAVGNGTVVVTVQLPTGENRTVSAELNNGIVSDVEEGENANQVLTISFPQAVLESIQTSPMPERTTQLAIQQNLIQLQSPNPLKNIEIALYKRTLNVQPFALDDGQLLTVQGQTGVVQRTTRNQIVLVLENARYYPVLNQLGGIAGYTTPEMLTLLEKSRLSFSENAGILVRNPITEAWIRQTPRALPAAVLVDATTSQKSALQQGFAQGQSLKTLRQAHANYSLNPVPLSTNARRE